MKNLFICLFIFLLGMGMISGCSFLGFGEKRKEVKPGSIKIADLPARETGDDTGNQIAVETIQAILKTSMGDIKIDFFPFQAPKTVMNFANLARDDFYNGVKFHRVIAGFMIQTGDPNSRDDDKSDDGQGGPGYTFEDEINIRSLAGVSEEDIVALEAKGYVYNDDIPSSHNMVRGMVAMANSGANTNGSQFFVMTGEEAPWLDGLHTVFGQVIEGMDVVDAIEMVEVDESDYPVEDIVVEDVVLYINEELFGDANETNETNATNDVDANETNVTNETNDDGVDSVGDVGDVGNVGDVGDVDDIGDVDDGGETTDGEGEIGDGEVTPEDEVGGEGETGEEVTGE